MISLFKQKSIWVKEQGLLKNKNIKRQTHFKMVKAFGQSGFSDIMFLFVAF